MDIFEYVMVMVSIIVGLALTHLLQGLVEIAQRPRPIRLWSIHLVWVAYMLVLVAFWWWWQFRLQQITWSFHHYVFVLGYAALLYVISTLLFPKVVDPDLDLDAFFYENRGWFFGLFTLFVMVDLADTWMKGPDHFASLGFEYPIRSALFAVGFVVAMRTRNPVYHWALGLSVLFYQITYAIRQFGVVA